MRKRSEDHLPDPDHDETQSQTLTDESSSWWFLIVTVFIITLGMLSGTFVKAIYNEYSNNSLIVNSNQVSLKIKMMDSVVKILSRNLKLNRRRTLQETVLSLGFSESIYRIEDRILNISSDSESTSSLPIKLYYPSESKDLPIIIFFHGGDWVHNSIDTNDKLCRHLSNEVGSIIISVGYRLSPENIFPSAFYDSYEATRWVYNNAKSIKGNKRKIIVMGESAGANLAASIVLENHKNGEKDFRVRHQILAYPPTNLLETNTTSRNNYYNAYIINEHSLNFSENAYTNGSQELKADPRCSPLLFQGNLKGLPPAFILIAEFDPLQTEALQYVDKLENAGIEVKYQIYQDVHGFMSFFGTIFETSECGRAVGDIEIRLNDILKDSRHEE